MGSIRCQGDVQCIGVPNRTRVEKRDSLKRFSTFTHVMRADANSQEKLLDLVSETLDRAVLYSDYLNVSFQYFFHVILMKPWATQSNLDEIDLHFFF
jgi:hypothetical protein